MSTVTLHIGDVHDVMATLPDSSVDLIVTSPPFLALRSYLPADHPDKAREIGSEATPAAFLDTLLALTAEWRRILAPHGSLCVELGDTYSGSGGAGGDYGDGGLRDGQAKFDGSGRRNRPADVAAGILAPTKRPGPDERDRIPGWPLAKSLTGIPTLYTWSLAYGRNLLTGAPSPAGQWRIRNLLVWVRPNPPVGALGDKFRPACSYITVACTGPRRWFDLDAVRTEARFLERNPPVSRKPADGTIGTTTRHIVDIPYASTGNPAGAPPLDWHSDVDDGPTGDRLWQMPTQPYSGAHYATYPLELPRRLIQAMCPRQVCRVCGKPRERITCRDNGTRLANRERSGFSKRDGREDGGYVGGYDSPADLTIGWSDCGHDNWRPGIVLDPFLGSGTTAVAAAELGRDCIGIDLDARNTGLVDMRLRERVHIVNTSYRPDGETEREPVADHPAFRAGYVRNDRSTRTPQDTPHGSASTTIAHSTATTITWHCDPPLPDQRNQIQGQINLFDHLEGATGA